VTTVLHKRKTGGGSLGSSKKKQMLNKEPHKYRRVTFLTIFSKGNDVTSDSRK
jgi:hypothetical protein